MGKSSRRRCGSTSGWRLVVLSLLAGQGLAACDAGSVPEGASGVVRRPVVGVWESTGPMGAPRTGATATRLGTGEVLVAGGGGDDAGGTYRVWSSAELYDPAARTWRATGDMIHARTAHSAVLLADGRVLVAGGYVSSSTSPMRDAEIYDPSTGRWTITGPLTLGRDHAAAVLLPDDSVLVTGGYTDATSTVQAETWDPATGLWTRTGYMTALHGAHTATLLPSGLVLVAAGSTYGGTHAVAELYDPATRSFTATGSLNVGRAGHVAHLLSSGEVLVAGGCQSGGFPPPPCTTSTELYNPATGTWRTTTGALAEPRSMPGSALLPDGRVLVAGGGRLVGGRWTQLATAELFDPATESWTSTGSMLSPRYNPVLVVLPVPFALAAGGTHDDASLASAELFDFGSGPGCLVCDASGSCVTVSTGAACADCGICSAAGTCEPRSAGTACRAAAGPCDATESCDGAMTTCPTDARSPAGSPCRPAVGPCDMEERCDGSTAACPADSAAPDGTPCADADACNGAESCAAGVCTAGTAPDCDDGNPCTSEACEPSSGCTTPVAVADGTSCADGDTCNGSETCAAGVCTAGTAPVCDDGNPCTADSCAPAAGCRNEPVVDGTPCSTATICGGSCASGACGGGFPVDCDDDDPCTTDGCDDDGACTHAPATDGLPCDDGSTCSEGDACSAGVCTGAPVDCADGDPCTVETCDPDAGCVVTDAPDGTACDDGSACTARDGCTAGTCRGIPVDCDDGNPCTTDECEPVAGCRAEPRVDLPCDDGEPGTVGDVCAADGTCAGTPVPEGGSDGCGCRTVPSGGGWPLLALAALRVFRRRRGGP